VSEAIVSVDTSKVQEGKLEELQVAVSELVEFVDKNEPRPVAYSVYLNDDGTLMTVIQVHPDSASMEFHMDVAAPVFTKFKELITLSAIDIYGKPSAKLVEQMRQKAHMLGNAPLALHELQGGFSRLDVR
jgi:hypothetical protein